VALYDSLAQVWDSGRVRNLAQTLALRLPDPAGWTTPPCPRQPDAHNCGVASMLCAVHAAAQVQLPQSVDWTLWRLLIAVFLSEALREPYNAQAHRAAVRIRQTIRHEYSMRKYRVESVPLALAAAEEEAPGLRQQQQQLAVDDFIELWTKRQRDIEAALDGARRQRERNRQGLQSRLSGLRQHIAAAWPVWVALRQQASLANASAEAELSNLRATIESRNKVMGVMRPYPSPALSSLEAELVEQAARLPRLQRFIDKRRRFLRGVAGVLDELTSTRELLCSHIPAGSPGQTS